jgi:ABC-type multidrug transport system fused ATPase/permease subunit
MSVGQKQRVAIARCIIRNPEIFIMDEPTSNLDAKSEKELMNSLHNFIESRTTIIVAHRLSSITFADKIIVMNEGSIVESGTHSELLSKEGYYASLWHTQTENSQQKTLVYN